MSQVDEEVSMTILDQEHNIFTDQNQTIAVCMTCRKVISYDRNKTKITRHVQSEKHSAKMKENRKIEIKQLTQIEFEQNIVECFTAAAIPLTRLDNPALKYFLEDSTGRKVPSERTVRAHETLNHLKEKVKKDIETDVINKSVVIMVDESSDNRQKFVCNVLVGVLEGTKANPLRLYRVVSLVQPLNSDILMGIFQLH